MSGHELKTLRKLLGWSVARTAKKFNRSSQVWYVLERSDVVPPEIADAILQAANNAPKRQPAQTEPAATPAHLTTFRNAFNLSQGQAAALLGVSRVTWNRWENKQSPVPRSMLLTLRGLVQKLKLERTENES